MSNNLFGEIMSLSSVQEEGKKTLQEISSLTTGLKRLAIKIKPKKKKEEQEENE